MLWFEGACRDVLWMALAMGGAWSGSACRYGAAAPVILLLIATPLARWQGWQTPSALEEAAHSSQPTSACNLYFIIRGRDGIQHLFGVTRDEAGNLPPLPGVLPNTSTPLMKDGAQTLTSPVCQLGWINRVGGPANVSIGET